MATTTFTQLLSSDKRGQSSVRTEIITHYGKCCVAYGRALIYTVSVRAKLARCSGLTCAAQSRRISGPQLVVFFFVFFFVCVCVCV